MKNSSVAIVVPAKVISKRLPSKNLLCLGGKFGNKTLVEIAVDRSLESGLGMVVVSSDGHGVLRQARIYSTAEVYFMKRSNGLNEGTSRAWEVCLDSVDRLQLKCNMKVTTVVMTLPTSPFCSAEDLINAVDLFYKKDRRPVMSVKELNFNPATCATISNDGVMWRRDGGSWGVLTVSERVYLSNGAVWVCDVEMLRKRKEQYIAGMVAYVMPEERSIDINTQFDYSVASLLAQK
ncbi:MAG: hypothetical protein FVQ80_06770 [Planctomycetes bacterium]|nr:hypothetical protein [Planctomycetota bacterium]